jgi:prepilin-type N-terminal cleavage/methylation domain-containing protein/prepilin-type processing-associated H-X9-DG protein
MRTNLSHRFVRTRTAFTLIELLIVIAIVVVLAALLFPALNKSINLAYQAQSTGKLRAMGPALSAYVSDHDGYLIHGAISPVVDGRTVPFWFNALDPYMGADIDATSAGWTNAARPAWQNDPAKKFTNPPLYNGKGSGVGYGWNHQYFGYVSYSPYGAALGWGSKMLQVDKPSQTIIIGTSTDNVNSTDALQHVVLFYNSSTRFGGKGLFLFVDGHVQALTPAEANTNNGYLFKKTKPAQ